jgi:two-component sensor histidine kinase
VQERVADLEHANAALVLLLKEMHHHIKNNFQLISSLLSLQAEGFQDLPTCRLLEDTQDRVQSLALIHQRLQQSQNIAQLNFASYIHTLASQLHHSNGVEAHRVRLTTHVEDVWLRAEKTIPCGLILNELLSNALKYALPADTPGDITIELYAQPEQQATLVVRDTGVSFPAGIDFQHTDSFGLHLVCLLTAQLGGMMAIEPSGGTAFTLTFPL